MSDWMTDDYQFKRSTQQCASGQITFNILTQASWRLYEIRQPPTCLCKEVGGYLTRYALPRRSLKLIMVNHSLNHSLTKVGKELLVLKSPEHAIYSSFMDGCDVGHCIVQLGACKEVMKLTNQKLLTATQDTQLWTKDLKGCADCCTQLPQSSFC